MVLIKSGFLKSMRKSMGDSTFSRCRGRNVLKGKIESNSSKTLLQQKQRLKMKKLVALCDAFDSPISLGFPKRPIEQTVYNAFVAANQGAVEVSDELEVTVFYEKVACSSGKLRTPDVTVTADAEARTLTFVNEPGWFGKNSEKTDLLFAVVLEKVQQVAQVYPLKARGEAGIVTMDIHRKWDMAELMAYVFVLSADKRKASKTVYLPLE